MKIKSVASFTSLCLEGDARFFYLEMSEENQKKVVKQGQVEESICAR